MWKIIQPRENMSSFDLGHALNSCVSISYAAKSTVSPVGCSVLMLPLMPKSIKMISAWLFLLVVIDNNIVQRQIPMKYSSMVDEGHCAHELDENLVNQLRAVLQQVRVAL